MEVLAALSYTELGVRRYKGKSSGQGIVLRASLRIGRPCPDPTLSLVPEYYTFGSRLARCLQLTRIPEELWMGPLKFARRNLESNIIHLKRDVLNYWDSARELCFTTAYGKSDASLKYPC
jgi:hypothetical protein